ncbi:MAG: DUF362 domain-containing protein [Candidatus Lokiarchaeota archaeon]|nr:DUF362 domain-containing protein [Candidatus Lokiarchaeota archaeon]
MINGKTDVAIIQVADHKNLVSAIKHGLDLIKFNSEQVVDKNVLLKPNCLQASEKAITSPEVVAAVSKIMKDFGARVDIGDSPMSGGTTAESIYKKIKKFDLIRELGQNPNWISLMENPELIQRKYFKKMEKTVISKNFLDASFVVNLPKYKTHFLTSFTGAIKNFWGIQTGTTKSKSHLYGKSPKNFGIVLADLFNFVHEQNKSNLVIMDAIKIMHGRGGPSFGNMMELGLMIIGTDAVAIDTVCVNIAGYDVKNVHYLEECSERGLGISDINKINILGIQVEEIKSPSKVIFPVGTYTGLIGLFQGVGNRFFKQYPHLKKNQCKKCGECVKLCPAESIKIDEITGYPKFKRKDCINCLCCVEGCPQQALKPRMAGMLGSLGLY